MSEPVTPYTHDCKKCHFIGHLHDTANHQLDIYICLKPWGDASLVIRHGNDGPEYWSYPVFGLHKMMEEVKE